MEPTTRHSLLLRLRNSEDQAAWAEFVDLYEPLLYRLARAKSLQDADARDLCQEVFRSVAGAIERWDPDPEKGSFRGWLFRIARNLTVNFLANRGRGHAAGGTTIQQLLEQQPDSASESAANAEFTLEFRRRAFRWAADQVRDEFSESTWRAFWRTGIENRPAADVAAELGLSVGAVYVARSRVMARLRQRIETLTSEIGIEDFAECGDGHAANFGM